MIIPRTFSFWDALCFFTPTHVAEQLSHNGIGAFAFLQLDNDPIVICLVTSQNVDWAEGGGVLRCTLFILNMKRQRFAN